MLAKLLSNSKWAFVLARKGKYKNPEWYEKFMDRVYPQWYLPDWLTDKILENDFLSQLIGKLPRKCPFEKSYELIIFSKPGKAILVYHVPALCKFNPFFRYLLELRSEVLAKTKIQSDIDNLMLPSVFEIHKNYVRNTDS